MNKRFPQNERDAFCLDQFQKFWPYEPVKKKNPFPPSTVLGAILGLLLVILFSLFWTASDLNLSFDNFKATTFFDVTGDHSNYDAIAYVEEAGIVRGYSDGSFKPDATINRAEFSKIIVEAAPGYEPPRTECFPDVQTEWFAPYVCEAKNRGIVNGYPDGFFRPEREVTFVEAAKMISAAFGYNAPLDPIWYRPYVQELESRSAIPTSLNEFAEPLTRGEMAEMVYRIRSNIRTKSGLTYDALEQLTTLAQNPMDPFKRYQERMKIIALLPPSTASSSFIPPEFFPTSEIGPPPIPPGVSAIPLTYDAIAALPPPSPEPEIAYNSPLNPPPLPPELDAPVSTVNSPTIQDLYPPKSIPYLYAPQNDSESPSYILIFSDETTYTALAAEIERLAEDIRLDLGVMVAVFHDNYTHAYDVQAVLKRYAADASKKLLGSLLIGDVPPFYQEEEGQLYRPTDFFYQDLDAPCTFNERGYLTMVNSSKEPCSFNNADYRADYFTGRITPPVKGSEGVALIKKYLDNNHAYRTGALTYDERVLVYPAAVLEGLQSGAVEASIAKLDSFGETLDGLKEYTKDQLDYVNTQDFAQGKSEYLGHLKNHTYEAAAIEIHGSVSTQWVGGSVDVTPPDIQAAAPSAFYIDITACSNGNFLSSGDWGYTGYMAGWFLFSGKTMVVQATIEPFWAGGIISNGRLGTVVPLTLTALDSGAPAYDVMRINRSLQLIKQTFGDPTLRLKPPPPASARGAHASVVRSVDLGIAKGGERKDVVVMMRNDGDQPLTLRHYITAGLSINGLWVLYGIDDENFDALSNPSTFGLDTFYGFIVREEYRYPQGGMDLVTPYLFNPMTIEPGEERALVFSFTPGIVRGSGKARTGAYKDIFQFVTNDPTQPFVEIEVKGEGV